MISIIVPTYNSEKYIKETIESILSQTFTDFEIIIVDNYSVDNTTDIANGFNDERIQTLKFNNNGVIAASRNYGIENSNGEYIALIDSDDIWYPSKLELCAQQLLTSDLVHHSMATIDSEGVKQKKNLPAKDVSKFSFKKLIKSRNYIQNSSVIFRRSIISKFGYFSTNVLMAGAEDFEYWLRIFRGGARFNYLDRQLGAYRVHFGGFSNRDMSVALNAVYQEFFKFLSPYTKSVLLQIVAYNHLNYKLRHNTFTFTDFYKSLFPITFITFKAIIKFTYEKIRYVI